MLLTGKRGRKARDEARDAPRTWAKVDPWPCCERLGTLETSGALAIFSRLPKGQRLEAREEER